MDRIGEFIKSGYGYGSGSGSGSGDGSGSGYGSGSGSGDGSGSGYGDGSGDGYGYGSGSGYGDGSGYGYGSGSGSGDGSGYGYGDGSGSGVATFNGRTVYEIDGVQTVITSVRGNVARGFILGGDLKLRPTYIAKQDGHFAHGDSLGEAVEGASRKAIECSPDEDRIAKFLERFTLTDDYPASDFFEWHGLLTLSCKAGREQFMKDRGIRKSDRFTVAQFIEIAKDAYGGEVIKKLAREVEVAGLSCE